MHCFAVIFEVSCEVFPYAYFWRCFFEQCRPRWNRSINSYFEKHHLKSCVGVVDSTWPVYCYFILCVFFRGKKKWFKRHSCNKFVAALFFFSPCSSIAATNLLHLAFFFRKSRGGKKKRQRHKKENTGGLNPGLSWARTSMELKTCAARHVFARHISARHVPHDPFPSPGPTITYSMR